MNRATVNEPGPAPSNSPNKAPGNTGPRKNPDGEPGHEPGDQQAERIAVLGAGSWGTALAIQFCRNGHAVRLWGHEPEHIASLVRDSENRAFLPGVSLPASLEPVADLGQALANATAVLVVVPSQFFADVLALMVPLMPADMGIAWATKGFEPGTGRLKCMSSIEFKLPEPMAIPTK